MQTIMDVLHNRYRVTNLDQTVIGNSIWQDHIKNIHDLADALLPALPERATYINWSFGGLIAISIAIRYPKRVTSIININSSPKFIEDIDWPAFPKPGFQVLIPLIKENGFENTLKGFYADEFKNINPKPNSYNELIKDYENVNYDLNAVKKRLYICDETDLRQEYQLLECLIDFIFGEKDSCVPIELHKKIKELNDKAKFHIIPDAKHMLHWTHPAEFNKILYKILQIT